MSELGETTGLMKDFAATQEEAWSRMSLLQRVIHQMDALLTVVGLRSRTEAKWIGYPCTDQLLAL